MWWDGVGLQDDEQCSLEPSSSLAHFWICPPPPQLMHCYPLHARTLHSGQKTSSGCHSMNVQNPCLWSGERMGEQGNKHIKVHVLCKMLRLLLSLVLNKRVNPYPNLPVIFHWSLSPALNASVLLTHLCLELVRILKNPPWSFSREIIEGNNLDNLTARCLRSSTPFGTSLPSISSV